MTQNWPSHPPTEAGGKGNICHLAEEGFSYYSVQTTGGWIGSSHGETGQRLSCSITFLMRAASHDVNIAFWMDGGGNVEGACGEGSTPHHDACVSRAVAARPISHRLKGRLASSHRDRKVASGPKTVFAGSEGGV